MRRIFEKFASFLASREKGKLLITFANKTPLRFLTKSYFSLLNLKMRRIRKSLVPSVRLEQKELEVVARLVQDGYARLENWFDRALLERVEVQFHEAARKRKERKITSNHPKDFWVRLSDEVPQGDLNEKHPLVQLATNPGMLRIAASYFKEAPYLEYVIATQSIYTGEKLKVSQLWHQDRDDTKILKLFVYLSDVPDSESGPFTFYDRRWSKKIGNPWIMRHLPDQDVFKKAPESEKIEMKGPRFTAFLCDTNSCYHMGSRLAPNRQRLMFSALYTTLPSNYPWGGKSRIQLTSRAGLSPLQTLSLVRE